MLVVILTYLYNMGKDKKTENTTKKQVNNETINTILLEDKNNIDDATTNAIKHVDSVAYADNLVEPSKSSKSIRKLNIKGNNENINSIEEEKTKEKVGKSKEIDDSKNDIIKEENVNSQEYKVVDTKQSHKTAIILTIAFLFIVLLFLLFSTIFALLNCSKTTIISGVSIKEIDVSGLTKEQALEKISVEFSKKTAQSITLKHNDFEQVVVPEQFEISFSLDEAVNMAYSKGRSRKYFSK